MAIIIGANTHVSFGSGCVISVNWGLSPNSQRLYCLGSWNPFITINKPTSTLSVTCYAPGPSYGTAPTLSCTNANTMSAGVTPGSCGGGGGSGVAGSWYVTSYSYSKDDAIMPGQESWSMMQYTGENLPSYVLRGVAEGAGTDNSGIVIQNETASSSTGSVSAGGFGRADTLRAGTISSVGGGSSGAGETGQGSASIPYTPLYIGN